MNARMIFLNNRIFEFLVRMYILFFSRVSHRIYAFHYHKNRGKLLPNKAGLYFMSESKQCCKNCSRKRCKKVLDKKYMFALVYMRQWETKGEERRGRGWRNEGTKLGDKNKRSSVNTFGNEKAKPGNDGCGSYPPADFPSNPHRRS